MAKSMCIASTPLETYPDLGMVVKREDLCCPAGPHFSKTRGVWAHIEKRNESLIGCLDTSHSQGGWATAQACRMLGKASIIFYPSFVKPRPLSASQVFGQELGAELVPLQAGRSAVLYHQAKAMMRERGGYMMPNALKLDETVEETTLEFVDTAAYYAMEGIEAVLVSASSGTIAAGVFRGMRMADWRVPLLVHLGYDRSAAAVERYIQERANLIDHRGQIMIYNEQYAYKDKARPGPDAPFPCNEHYDLKAFRWYQRIGHTMYKPVLFWNVG
jgi:threonine dehydratase